MNAVAGTRVRVGPSSIALVALALAARLGPVLNGGGIGGALDYDASVYYASGDALAHGRLPYRDFVFVHPPVISIVLAPFATIGRVVGDHRGFVLACLAFALLGAVNALLVTRVATRFGARAPAALAGGAFYAVWPGATGSEYVCRLEPLGNFFVLLGLLAYLGRPETDAVTRRKDSALCGVALGLAMSTKIWWAAAAVVVGIAIAITRRGIGQYLVGLVATLAVVNAPFFVLAPRSMTRMILFDQVTRAQNHPLSYRLGYLSGISHLVDRPSHGLVVAMAVATTVVVLALAGLAAGAPNGTLVGALLLVEFAVLALAPSYFVTYDDFLAPAAGVALALALVRRQQADSQSITASPKVGVVSIWALATATVIAAIALTPQISTAYPGVTLAKALRHSRCVASDSPMALILLDVLSRDFSRGCRVEVDLAGRRFDLEHDKANSPMVGDPRWQSYIRHYLLGEDAVALYPRGLARFNAPFRQALLRAPVLATSHGYAVRRTSGLG